MLSLHTTTHSHAFITYTNHTNTHPHPNIKAKNQFMYLPKSGAGTRQGGRGQGGLLDFAR